MKSLILLLLIIHTSFVFAQTKADTIDVEKKYSYVEVWGLKEQSRKNFLTEITSYPEGICQQSLTKMGYPDGNKIPLRGKVLITLRHNPDFRTTAVYKGLEKKKVTIDKSKWSTLLLSDLGFYEKQQLPFFLKAFAENNTPQVDSIFDSLETEFKDYGIQLDKQKIFQAYDVYKKSSEQLTKQDVLAVLYFSNNDSLMQAANFIASHYIKTSKDFLDFLPLLLRHDSNIQIALNQYLSNPDGNVKWEKQMDLLPKLVNNPNPFKAVLTLKILDKTGFNKSVMKRLRGNDLLTLKEILSSGALPNEKDFVVNFLNKYSTEPIENNAAAWVQKL
ncbi:hypothetical protein [Pontibacter litorisediminis]|uniref:hypothetical protein n=1 Tax=Pontibacter litorisediminis TaxID=1846260 RepID=UPI0023EC060E|nr:hypothetical protein [Pontibacter litorisediminis]